MTTYGYTLSSEEHPPSTLVDLARRAEAVGFDFLTVSDHYHPWVQAQGHSPFVWSLLGAVAAVTSGGRSLLAAGVVGHHGEFGVDAAVEIAARDGRVVAKGLTRVDSDALVVMAGRRSAELIDGSGEVVHRDDLVVMP